MTAHTATRDAILATRTGSLADYWPRTDRGVSYRTLGPVPGRGDAVYAIAPEGRASAGLVVMVVRTGRVDVRGKGAQVRVRVDYPRDTGDAAGTLAFDAGSVGGLAPRVLFTEDPAPSNPRCGRVGCPDDFPHGHIG